VGQKRGFQIRVAKEEKNGIYSGGNQSDQLNRKEKRNVRRLQLLPYRDGSSPLGPAWGEKETKVKEKPPGKVCRGPKRRRKQRRMEKMYFKRGTHCRKIPLNSG